MESVDELTKKVKVYPNIHWSFKHDLAGYFDVVLYHSCGVREGKQQYWVQTEGDERIQARNRASKIKEF